MARAHLEVGRAIHSELQEVQMTWCFEQVRSVWLPRSGVAEVSCSVAALLALLAVRGNGLPRGLELLLAPALAWLLAACSLHVVRQIEDAMLELRDEISAERSLLPAFAVCTPAAVLCVCMFAVITRL